MCDLTPNFFCKVSQHHHTSIPQGWWASVHVWNHMFKEFYFCTRLDLPSSGRHCFHYLNSIIFLSNHKTLYFLVNLNCDFADKLGYICFLPLIVLWLCHTGKGSWWCHHDIARKQEWFCWAESPDSGRGGSGQSKSSLGLQQYCLVVLHKYISSTSINLYKRLVVFSPSLGV